MRYGAKCGFTATNNEVLRVGCYSARGCTSYLQVVCRGEAHSNQGRTIRCGQTVRYTGTGRSAWTPNLVGAQGRRVTLLSGRCVPGHSRDPDTYISGPCRNDDACSTGARCIFTARSNSQRLTLGFYNTHHRYTSYVSVQCATHNTRRATGPSTIRCGQTVRYTAYSRGGYTPRLVGAMGRHVRINLGGCIAGGTGTRNIRQPNGHSTTHPDTYIMSPCRNDDTANCHLGSRCTVARMRSNSQVLRIGCFSSTGCTSYVQVVCGGGHGSSAHGRNSGPRFVRCGQTVRYTATGHGGYQPILTGASGVRVTMLTGQCARAPRRGVSARDQHRINWWVTDTYNYSPCRNDDYHTCHLGSRCSFTSRTNRQQLRVGCYRGRCSSFLRVICRGGHHGPRGPPAGHTSNIHSVCWDRMGGQHCRMLKRIYQCNDALMLHGCLESCGFCRHYRNPHTNGHQREAPINRRIMPRGRMQPRMMRAQRMAGAHRIVN